MTYSSVQAKITNVESQIAVLKVDFEQESDVNKKFEILELINQKSEILITLLKKAAALSKCSTSC